MPRLLTSLLALAIALSASGAARTKQEAERTEARLKKDVTFLASPACEGRGPATEGLKKAGAYLAAEFAKIGLKPAFKGGYYQPFAIAGAKANVTLTGPKGQKIELKQGVTFTPLGTNQEGTGKGEVVFVGYGMQDAKAGYDDYAGLEVKGKVVVVINGTPRPKGGLPSFVQQVRLRAKFDLARKKGAEAVLVVNDTPLLRDGADRLVDFSYGRITPGDKHLPAVLLKRSVVDSMLPPGKSLSEIEKAIDRDNRSDSFTLPGWKAAIDVKRIPDALPLRNVVGVLEGAGPLANETVVIGAHYDHLGHGGPSSVDSPTRWGIHHGADDNASGTAAIVELARRFSAIENRQGRRLVFCLFAGEEQGLFGSIEYCKKPPFPLEKTASMLCLDMVGRLRKDSKSGKALLLTEGHGTAKPFKELIDGLAKKHDFTLSSKPGGMGPSDHASFCAKKVPVVFFWTNVHEDYHKPTDTADKINYEGIRRIVDLSEDAATMLATMPKPDFIAQKDTGTRPSKGPRLGIKPGYADDVAGVVADAVLPGGAAEKGGMKDGDIIIGIAGKPVKEIQSFMVIMAAQKPKTTIEVEVNRKGKTLKLKVPLD